MLYRIGRMLVMGAGLALAPPTQAAFSDNFNDGDANGWAVINDSQAPSDWRVVNGAFRQLADVGPRKTGYVKGHPIGSYAYYTPELGQSDYEFRARLRSDAVLPVDADDLGVMFRYRDRSNYYRLSFNSRNGFARLEKRVGGKFTPLATTPRGYSFNQILDVRITVQGKLILAELNGDPLFAVVDKSLATGSVALYARNAASFDEVRVDVLETAPRVVLQTPLAHSVTDQSNLALAAWVANAPAGARVNFFVDGAPAGSDDSAPFAVTTSSLAIGNHTVQAVLISAGGGALALDTNVSVGVRGRYDVGIGDSNTQGVGDLYSTDNLASDPKTIALEGYPAVLGGLLNAAEPIPHLVFNEGIGGDKSVDLLKRLPSILARHKDADRVLIQIGTNDSFGGNPIGSGLGCSDTACSGTFKGNLQKIINKVNAAGKTAYVAQLPPAFSATDGSGVFTDPLNAPRNQVIKDYNRVIREELTGRILGPDLFSFFLTPQYQRVSLFADYYLHPNGLGHHLVAHLWKNLLTGGSGLPLFLEDISRPLYLQDLMELGDVPWLDEIYALTAIPGVLAQSIWILPDNADRTHNSANFLSFKTDRPVQVYVAYDAGAGSLPGWLSGFAATGLTVQTTNPAAPVMNLFVRSFSTGTVTLGGNLAAGASGADAQYLVIVRQP